MVENRPLYLLLCLIWHLFDYGDGTTPIRTLRGRVVKTSPKPAVVGRRFEPCTASGGPMSNHLKGAILAGAGVLWIHSFVTPG